jgi:hypothetical protein
VLEVLGAHNRLDAAIAALSDEFGWTMGQTHAVVEALTNPRTADRFEGFAAERRRQRAELAKLREQPRRED